MLHSKIIEFYEDYKSDDFPFFETQSSLECEKIKNKIAEKINFESNLLSTSLTKKLDSVLYDFSPEPIDFNKINLVEILKSIGVKETVGNVFINWYNFDLIDEMNLFDFDKYLLDLWYPQEDIEIFTKKCNWIISLNHDSIVRYVNFDQEIPSSA